MGARWFFWEGRSVWVWLEDHGPESSYNPHGAPPEGYTLDDGHYVAIGYDADTHTIRHVSGVSTYPNHDTEGWAWVPNGWEWAGDYSEGYYLVPSNPTP